jgi:drug/metabolite transporter (DMT)-like permease
MDLRGTVMAVILSIVFGSNALAIKVSLIGIPPAASAAIRFIIASLIFYVYARFKKIELRMTPKQWGHVAVLGFLFGVQFTIFYAGVNYTTVSRAAILLNTQPFFVAILAHFFLIDDRLNVRKIVGILLAFTGVLFLFHQSGGGGASRNGYLLGDLLILIAALSWASQTIYIKRWLDDWETLHLVLHPIAIGIVVLCISHLIFERHIMLVLNREVVIAILYQSVLVAGIGYLAWTSLLLKYKATHLSAFIFLMPLSGVLLGTIFMKDPVTARLIGGLVFIAIGILVVNIRPKEFFLVRK